MPYSSTQMTTFFTNVHAGRAPTAAEQLLLNAWAQQNAAGVLTDAAALQLVVDSADAESTVALLTYQYFTGSVPTAAGLAYLVNSATNTTDLNDAYYAGFNIENRYINFSANLALSGPTSASFATTYGGFTVAQTIDVAYETIIGSAQAAAAGINVAAAKADIGGAARITYFTNLVNQHFPTATAAQKDLALKAEIIGYIMGEAVKANVGAYSNAASRLLADLAVDNVATLGASLTTSYSTAAGTSTGVSSFTLTAGTDNVTGTGGDDVINAPAGTYTTGDTVNGGLGIDSLNLTLTGAAPVGTIVGVEKLFITASPNSATLDLAGVAGVTEITNKSSANGATVTVNNVAAIATAGIDSTATALTVNYAAAAVAGTADASTLNLSGASNASFTTAGIETLTVNSTGSANTLSTLVDTGMTKLAVTGSANLTITGAVGGATIATVDASAATGAVTLTTGAGAGGAGAVGVTVLAPTAAAAGAFTVTTAGNKDTVTLGAGNATVDTAGGSDTINAGVGTNVITSGAGNDTVNLTGTKDTLRFAESGGLNSDVVNGFSATSVISFNLGTAATATAVAAANAQFGTVATGATSPTMSGVGGAAAATTFTAGTTFNEISTGGAIAAGSTIVELTGVFTDGTAAGAINALGVSATTGVATAPTGKFILVTYSVGNVAQVWSYAGDTTVNTDIDVAELSLVATLNGVAAGSLGPANFSTFLGAAAAAVVGPLAGQTINLTGTLNLVTNTANAAGQILTGAADTVNVAIGTLPTAAATATTGLTVIDSAVGDADVLNATVLSNGWDLGTLVSGIETVNLNLLVADNGFSAAAVLPGATAINFTGTGSTGAITNVLSGTALGLGAGYTGTVTNNDALAALTLNLLGNAGTSIATSPTFVSTGLITALTVNAQANSFLNANSAGAVFNATSTTVTGAGNLTLLASAAAFDAAAINASTPAYSGILTARIAAGSAAGSMDFTALGTGGVVQNLRVIDFSDVAAAQVFAAAQTITLGAVTGGGTLTINDAPTAATVNLTGLTVVQQGAALNDVLNVNLGANASGNLATGGISAVSTETVNLSSAATAGTAISVANILTAAAAGTQTVNVTGNQAWTLGTVTADTLSTTGVGSTGSVTATLANGASGVSFTGGDGASTITGSANADVIVTGAGNDVVLTGGGLDNISTGGGNDVMAQAGTVAGGVFTAVGAQNAAVTFTGGLGNDVFGLGLVAVANIATVTDLNLGSGAPAGQIDRLYFDLATAGAATIVSLAATQAAITAAGTLTLAADAAVNALNGAANNVGTFTYAGDTYLIVNGVAAGATYAAGEDVLVKITGVTGTLDASDIVII
ncbi:hypothetical protein [Tabrizicola sp.]|uniref:beta strand repeat-containing protein n=1 Tax=Tabrizicola sp. TaxID=2005166 RepID=UPI002734208A|nr:hypothetical protein [Tabrizicola sp.]MDP3196630.1 hypothetical protein [Tabrizicola sp.]